jgi:MFS family permease
MTPFYPIIARDKQLDSFGTGLIFSLQPSVAVLASCFLGNSLYIVGKRNAYTFGLLSAVIYIQGIALVLLASIERLPYKWFITISVFTQIFGGFAVACTYTAGFAIIYSDYGDRAVNIVGFMESFAGVGVMIGPLMAASAYGTLGFSGICLLSSAAIILSIIPMWFVLKSKRKYVAEDSEVTIWDLLSHRYILLDVSPVLLLFLAYGLVQVSLSPYLEEKYNYSMKDIGMVFFIETGLYTLFTFFFASVVHLLDKRWMMLVSISLQTSCCLLMGDIIGFEISGYHIIVGYTISSIGGSLAFGKIYIVRALPSMNETATDLLGWDNDDRLKDALSGILTAGTCIGEIIGPILGGLLVEFTSYNIAYICLFGVGILLMMLYYHTFYIYRENEYVLLKNDKDMEIRDTKTR